MSIYYSTACPRFNTNIILDDTSINLPHPTVGCPTPVSRVAVYSFAEYEYCCGTMTTSDFGLVAENLAADYLKQKGYSILDRNWRKPWGELDIVATKEGIVIFVEVKANRREAPGFDPELRAGSDKLRKVFRTAHTYLANRRYPPDQEWQIDIISIIFAKDRGVAKIRHYKNVEV